LAEQRCENVSADGVFGRATEITAYPQALCLALRGHFVTNGKRVEKEGKIVRKGREGTPSK